MGGEGKRFIGNYVVLAILLVEFLIESKIGRGYIINFMNIVSLLIRTNQ